MNFAAPFAMVLGAVALPIVLAYLQHRKLPVRPVSSVAVFRVLVSRQSARQRMLLPTRLLSLLLVLLALAALLVALIRPRWGTADGGSWIAVLDTTSSMAATDGAGATRFDRALDALDAHARALGDRDELALVAFGPEASVVSGPDRDHAAVVARARALVPAGDDAGFASALALTRALCRDRARVLWISDRPLPEGLPAACPATAVPIGRKAPNSGITAFRLREADSLGLTEAYLQVGNSAGARRATVTVTVGGAGVKVVQLDLPADGARDTLFQLTLAPGDAVQATLEVDGRDALAHDDVAWATASAGAPARVLLVTDAPASYFGVALAQHPRAALTVIAPGEPMVGAYDLAILESTVSTLPDAPRIVAVDDAARALGITLGPDLDDPPVVRWAFSHPLFRYVSLEDVHVGPAHALRVPEGAMSLIDTAKGSLATLSFHDDREILALGFRPDRSDLVLRVGFANLVANLVEWGAGAGGERPASLSLGSRWVGGRGTRLEPLAGGAPIPAGGRVVDPGVYRIRAGDDALGLVSVDLTAPDETVLGGQQGRFALPALSGRDVLPWRWLAAAALALLALEWALPGVLARVSAVIPHRRPRGPGRPIRVRPAPLRSPAPPPSAPGPQPRQGV